MNALLVEFLKRGVLGPLRCGMKQEEVAATCGVAEVGQVHDEFLTWFYGQLELTFVEERLRAIEMEFYGEFRPIPESVLPGWSMPERLPNLTEFQRFLDAHDIKWQIYDILTCEDQTTLETEALVLVTFGEDHVMDCMSCYPYRQQPPRDDD